VISALLGTFANAALIVVGAFLGLLLRSGLTEQHRRTMMHAVGLVVLFVGIDLAWPVRQVEDAPGVVVLLVALALGGVLGSALGLQDRLERFGDALQRRFASRGRFSEGFVTATLLFLVGPLAIVGSLQSGVSGDHSALFLKGVLDGVGSIAMAATFGVGVAVSAVPVLLYQGAIALSGALLASAWIDPAGDPRLVLFNGVGGLMIVGLGLNILEVTRIRVADLLPALVLVIPVGALFAWVLA